ncbi:MAG: hypothetical protein MJ097_02270 [Dorea sp.]|nr:hypothetical protein [Dorea sp.]
MLEDVLKKWNGVEVSAMEVYSDIFRLGDNEIQKNGEAPGEFKANPLGYWKKHDSSSGHYRVMFDDTFEETLKELQEADFSIMNCITYFGRRNSQDRASKMYAMIFDLDGVTDVTLNNFLNAAHASDYDIYPLPNYVILSGHGVHLYYVFEEPIPLYPNIKLQLKAFKYAMTDKIWNRYTSEQESPQHQGINQGFRVIGGKTKIPGVRVRAYKMNSHPFSLEHLGRYIPEEHRIDESRLWRESKLTLKDAKKKYPEWYQKKIVEGHDLTGHWTCKRDLYDWWKRQIESGAAHHHRYFCIMCLAIYAVKSGIEFEELEQDSLDLITFMNLIAPDDPFTESDVRSALECYDERYCKFPIDDISKISGIVIQRNKRNGRKQSLHLRIARQTLMIMNEEGEQVLQGRRPKEDIVKEWISSHPDGSVAQCAKDLQISRTTVYKYWN